MSRYERRGFSTWQKWVVQLALAATATCALLGTAEYMGGQHARTQVAQQQEWDAKRRENDMQRVAQAIERPWEPQPVLVVSYPERPLGPLAAEVRRHRDRSRDYTLLGLFSLFVTGTVAGTGFLRRRSVEETVEVPEPAVLAYDPIPPRDEIDESLVGAFEPTVCYGSNYGSEYAVLDEMMDTYELTFAERVGARISALLAKRRERIYEQLELANQGGGAWAPVTNYIEPVGIDRT